MFSRYLVNLVACILLLSFRHCKASSDDDAMIVEDFELEVEDIVSISMRNFENYDNEHFQQVIPFYGYASCYALFGTNFSTFQTVPVSLAKLISKGVTLLLDPSTKLKLPSDFNPDYVFIEKCYAEHPSLFIGLTSSHDLINRIRCKLLFNVENDPLSNYNAYLAHPQQYKKLLKSSKTEFGWHLRSVHLVVSNVSKTFLNVHKEVNLQKGKKLFIGGKNREERWKFLIDSYRQKCGDPEIGNVLTFLASVIKAELVKNTKKYGGLPLHRQLCLMNSGSLNIVPRDFIRCPPCAAPTDLVFDKVYASMSILNEETSSLIDSLPYDVLFSNIFLECVKDDFVHALTVLRLVCERWNKLFTLSDVQQVLSVTNASLPAAKLLIADAIVQVSQKMSKFSARPWPVIGNDDLYKLVSQCCYGNAFDLVGILAQQLEFLDLDFSIKSHSRILSDFVDGSIALYKEIMRTVKFDSYKQLGLFIGTFARSYNRIREGIYFTNLPLVLNNDILWPDPKEFLCMDFDQIWSAFSFSPRDILNYLHRAAENPSSNECIQNAAVLKKILRKCDKDLLLVTLHIEHYKHKMHREDIVRLVLENIRPGCVKEIESGKFEVNFHPRLDAMLIAGQRCPDFEYAIDGYFKDPGSMNCRRAPACLNMLAYICLNPDVYSQDDLRRFVGMCLMVGIHAAVLRDVVFLVAIGAPYKFFIK
jgi:hypothetical protein